MKVCILGFYERLTARAKPYNRLIDLSYLTFAVTFVAVILSTVLECRPFPVYCKLAPNACIFCAGFPNNIGTYRANFSESWR